MVWTTPLVDIYLFILKSVKPFLMDGNVLLIILHGFKFVSFHSFLSKQVELSKYKDIFYLEIYIVLLIRGEKIYQFLRNKVVFHFCFKINILKFINHE